MYLYIHGFNSSSLSSKAQVLKQWLAAQGREQEWLCPDLPHHPAQALDVLVGIVEQQPDALKIVGSSLGGFYATVLANRYARKTVVINPSVHSGIRLREALGRQTMWNSDETYEFTEQHLNALNAMDHEAIVRPDTILMMQERDDEVLNWEIAAHHYRDCHQLIFRGGDHSFTRFKDVLELIDRF